MSKSSADSLAAHRLYPVSNLLQGTYVGSVVVGEAATRQRFSTPQLSLSLPPRSRDRTASIRQQEQQPLEAMLFALGRRSPRNILLLPVLKKVIISAKPHSKPIADDESKTVSILKIPVYTYSELPTLQVFYR